MTKCTITEEQKAKLRQFLTANRSVELVQTYLYFVEQKFHLHPVVFLKEKKIYQSASEVVQQQERAGKLWHETEITIHFGHASVNTQTKKIYICPFSGKVFGDNTHPNPQDAIYDWVAKCPENKERIGGLRVKRFFVSDDPEVIKGYIDSSKTKHEPVKKVVFSSVLSGKLYNTKAAVIKDFESNYLKKVDLAEIQNQNKYQIEDQFLDFLQKQLTEDKIASFVEALAEDEQFLPFVERWTESED